jgi:hypothetical protein
METPATPHPFAVEHLPSFITPPGQTDVLFSFVVVFMVLAIFAAGVLYMRLHALPEHLAHRTQKVQLEIVAVLGLIALFTHSRIFWIAALLLAMIDLPDFLSPLRSMAASLSRIAGGRSVVQEPAEMLPQAAQEPDRPTTTSETSEASPETPTVSAEAADLPEDGTAASREGQN